MNLFRSCLFSILAAVVLGSGVSSASADPTKYRLNGGTEAVGNATHTEKHMTLTDGDFTLSTGGQSMDGKMSMTSEGVENGKVTAAENGRATVMEVVHDKDETTQKISLAGQEVPNKETSPLQGTTVIRRRTGDNWTDTLKDGSTPTAKQKKRLYTNHPDDAALMYPAGEIAVGDTWTVPSSSLQRLFGDDVESVTGNAQCKLLRVEQFDGQSCGVVQINMDATGTGADDSGQKMKMNLKVQGTVYRSLQRPVDLKTDMQGTLKITGSVGMGGGVADLTVTGPITISEHTTLTQ